MKHLFATFFVLLFVLSCEVETPETYSPKKAPSPWFYMQRAFPHEKVDQNKYFDAVQTAQKMRSESLEDRCDNCTWEFLGPTNIGGRIVDLESPAHDINTIYAAAAAGGIFKSTDKGLTWSAIFDDAMSLSIGDIGLSSDGNTLYVGTGEANGGGGSIAYDGLGVYKSQDGGQTWQHMGLENVGSIGRIIVDPKNSNRVIVAAMGSLFGNSEDRGVYHTNDGGESWSKILYRDDKTGAIDLAMDPFNSSIIYAAMWQRERTPQNINYSGENSGIYKSTDGGGSWTELTNGLPISGNQKGRIGLAVSERAPSNVWAIYANSTGTIQGIYKSLNGGSSWSAVSIDGISNPPYMWWFGKIWIDPNDEDVVVVASLHMYRTEDGGQTWTRIFNGAHVDQHALIIHPTNSNFIVSGNDGGIYISEAAGSSYAKVFDLPITQFYTVEVDPQNENKVFGGTQDNSSMRTYGPSDDWKIVSGGDGFVVQVDPLDSNYVYTEYQYGGFLASTNAGNSFFSATNGIDPADRKNWQSPFMINPHNNMQLFFGANRMYRTDDRAASWFPISPDLTNGDGGGNRTYGTITTMDISPINSDIIYAGTDDGKIWIGETSGDNWTEITNGLPLAWVTRVKADPFNEDFVYATLSGFRYNENEGNVYFSPDKGQSWENITYNLVNAPVNDIEINTITGALYIATDVGVFILEEDATEWSLLNTGIPNVIITDLKFHEPSQYLYAATYGRSMYKLNTQESVQTNQLFKENFKVNIGPNPSTGSVSISGNTEKLLHLEFSLLNVNGSNKTFIKKAQVHHDFTIELNIPYKTAGTYILQIKDSSSSAIVSKKIILL